MTKYNAIFFQGKYKSLFWFVSLMFLFPFCKKDNISTNSNFKLKFSQNEILFDTIFTQMGSATKRLKVYNPNNQAVEISKIYLEKGKNSEFRLNIDGLPSNEAQNVYIAAKDSLYIFVEVTINPNGANSPLVINDAIVFYTNGNEQKVNLEAWGQDAIYIKPDVFPHNAPAYKKIDCNTTFTNQKPYVIYGYAMVDSACTLTIEAGAKIHFHNNSGLWVYRHGTLKVNGTKENPVYFQGTRLEQDYKDVYGQWNKILINEGSSDHVIQYAIIKNATTGIELAILSNKNDAKTIDISNTQFYNFSQHAILSTHFTLNAYNLVIGNCGNNAVKLVGGNYKFLHCTITNYWTQSTNKSAAVSLNNFSENASKLYDLSEAYFANTIVVGNSGVTANEVELNFKDNAQSNFKFENCLLNIASISTNNETKFINILKNKDPLFVDVEKNNYKLNPNSPAIDKGSSSIVNNYLSKLAVDILGNSRTANLPDLGAYEVK